jgi:GNAT superfamily N-acetyltransferase
MPKDLLLLRAQGLWRELASAPVSFGAAGDVSVVVSPGSQVCPPGWVGVVLLGGAAIVTAPTEEAAVRLRAAVAELSADELTDPEALGKLLTLGEVLGPVALAYVAADGFRPVTLADLQVEELDGGHPNLECLVKAAAAEEADEAGLHKITSPAFVVRVNGELVAAAGYCAWPGRTAHVSVLTASAWRGRGLARATGSAAVRHALAQDLLPQWRARVPASRKAAIGLGFTELGFQLRIRLA